MKRLLFILFLLTTSIIPMHAKSFVLEDKVINLIDFDGYKHKDYTALAEQYKALDERVLYDLLIPNDAMCPAIDPESMVYNDFFIVFTQPKMLYGTDVNEEMFAYLRKNLAESCVSEGFSISEDKLNTDYSDIMAFPIEDISEPRLLINDNACIGFSNIVSFDGINQCISNYNALVLVKGKIIWIAYCAANDSIIGYENNTSKFIKFIKLFQDSNQDERILTERERKAQNYALLISNDLKSTMKTISSKGNNKANGLEYSFLVPESFEEKASKNTHIVHSLYRNYGDYQINVNVMVDDSFSSLKGLVDYDSILEKYKDEIIRQYVPKTATVINSGTTSIGRHNNALFLEYKYNQSVLNGINMGLYHYQILTVHDGLLTVITFSMGGLDDDFDYFIDVFKPLFIYLSSTFTFKGNNNYIQSNASKQIEKQVNNAMLNFFAISILIPSIMGAILGLIVRYLVIRHPINKSKATIFSIIIGLALIFVAYVEFDDIGAIGVFLGTLICHYIIRIGHTEYDEEIERIERQKAQAEQMFDEASVIHKKAEEKYSKAKEEQEKARKTWQEAQLAKNNANEEKEKAQYAAIELEKLREELRKVKERNKRLEEDIQSKTSQTSRERVIKDRAYYESVLEIISPYSKADLKKAFLQKSMLYHPDRVNSLGPKLKALAEEEMKEINVAYDKLQKYCTN